jgi:hypothetical protein
VIHALPPPPSPTELSILAAATSLCLVLNKQLPATSQAVQAAADRALVSIGLPRIHPSVALPIWTEASKLIQDPEICPLLLHP